MIQSPIAPLESNFVSVVAYLHNSEAQVRAFLQRVTTQLALHFAHYEIVLVNDASTDGSVQAVHDFLQQSASAMPVSIVHMSLSQGKELCMNAGLDLAIGDFAFEFDTLDVCWEPDYFYQAYTTALQGYDVVSVTPAQNRNFASSLFYKVFNANSGSRYRLQTDLFRVVSRRALNRVRAISATSAYRKAAYAASGLKVQTLVDAKVNAKQLTDASPKMSLALDSLALYTNVAQRASFCVALLMALSAVAELCYTIWIYISGVRPVEGWTTTMFVLTLGFFGVFLILTIVLKYLALLLELVFKNQKYLVESIEKIQK